MITTPEAALVWGDLRALLVWTGCAGLGLVWGWLVALRVPVAGGRLSLWSWLALALAVALQASVVVWWTGARTLIAFGIAFLIALTLHLFRVAALARVARPATDPGGT